MTKAIYTDNWTIEEREVVRERMQYYDTIFTIGNGYLGIRGTLEEGYKGVYPGTYIAGIYDKASAISSDLVNCPNPLGIDIIVDGTRMDIDHMEVMDHNRTLDIKHAVLKRRTVFVYGNGRRIEYTSRRFFSLKDMHIGIMEISIKPLDSHCNIILRKYIDGNTENKIQPFGHAIKHYKVVRNMARGNKSYLEIKTHDLGLRVGFAMYISTKHSFRWVGHCKENLVINETKFRARKNNTYKFIFLFSVYTSRDGIRGIKKACLDSLKVALKKGIQGIYNSHKREWLRRWSVCNVEVSDENIMKAIRFNMYHLLIAAPINDIDTSIGAKTLSGEWYKGHVFWDNEIYVLPFFILTLPKVARNLLMYRYRRLEQARAKARKYGFRGAFWPWESALTGIDETPNEWVNFDGTKIPVYNMEREIHICGDIVYAIHLYHKVTEDREFMINVGCEMVFETARFWASRVELENNKYHIRGVVGPNEFQECVDDNSYTNYLAKFTLLYAVELYNWLRSEHPRKLKILMNHLKLKEGEIEHWVKVARDIVFLKHTNGLIEEFDGYFKKKDVVIEQWDKNGMPLFPSSVKLSEVSGTQLVKQADVILLFHLFPDDFTEKEKRKNIEYYEKRTVHKSSLSPPTYAIAYFHAGRIEDGYRYLLRALFTDLKDIYSNTHQGVHAAALGGSWQAIVLGLCGLRIKDDGIYIAPNLPEAIKYLKFRIWHRGNLFEIYISRDECRVIPLKIKSVRRNGRKQCSYEVALRCTK